MDIFYETVENLRGTKIRRLRTNLFYILSVASLVAGVAFLSANKIEIGLFLILTLFPIFLLYPLIRFLLGGKDGLVPVIATAVVEEVVKRKIIKKIEAKSNRK